MRMAAVAIFAHRQRAAARVKKSVRFRQKPNVSEIFFLFFHFFPCFCRQMQYNKSRFAANCACNPSKA